MKFNRRYIQYNELVIDGYDMLNSSDSTDTSFKGKSYKRTGANGSYRAFKARYLFVDETDVSMSLTLRMKKIPCDMRKFYRPFVIDQLSQPGKLWAVHNNELIWAYATVDSYSEITSDASDELSFDVNFVLYEGIWHKADQLSTFLVPYSPCYFLDCKGYHTEPALDCCVCSTPVNDGCECCECRHKEDALVYHMDDIQSFYDCDVKYQIEVDCEAGARLFGDSYLGKKVCSKDACSNIVAGRLWSGTDTETRQMTITLRGQMYNPAVEINGNVNMIKGEYDGELTIMPNGDVYYCDCLLDPDVWMVTSGVYGWSIYPGYNRVIVDFGTCCHEPCVYIKPDEITI